MSIVLCGGDNNKVCGTFDTRVKSPYLGPSIVRCTGGGRQIYAGQAGHGFCS